MLVCVTSSPMPTETDEELRVLFAAAEKGRADIINTVVDVLAAKARPGPGDVHTRVGMGGEKVNLPSTIDRGWIHTPLTLNLALGPCRRC